jgi:hypothetical protein
MTSAKHILVSTFFIMTLATKNAGGGPTLMIPSGELAGTEVTAPNDDWSFASTSSLELKTRPADPYSVQLNYIVREGRLYIDAAEGKAWLEHMRLDPLVRVLFATQIYPLRTVLVGQPGKLEGSDPTRFIYRLDPC